MLFNNSLFKEKHRQVCLKTNQKQRKPFDVQAARVQGTEMEKYVLRKAVSDEAPKVFILFQHFISIDKEK